MGSGNSHLVTAIPIKRDRTAPYCAPLGSTPDGRSNMDTKSPVSSWRRRWRAFRPASSESVSVSTIPSDTKIHSTETILFGQKMAESEICRELLNSMAKSSYPGSLRPFRQPHFRYGYHGLRLTTISKPTSNVGSNTKGSSFHDWQKLSESPVWNRLPCSESSPIEPAFDRNTECNTYPLQHRQLYTTSSRMRYVKAMRSAVSVPDLSKVPVRSSLKGGRNSSHFNLTQKDNSVIPEVPSSEENSDSPTSLSSTLSTPSQQISPMVCFSDPERFGIENLSPLLSDDIFSAPILHPHVPSTPFFFTPPQQSPGSPVLTTGNMDNRPSRNKCFVKVHNSEDQNVDSLLADAHEEEEVDDIAISPERNELSFPELFQTDLVPNPSDSQFDDEGVSCDWTPHFHSIPLRRDSLGQLLDQTEGLLNHFGKKKESQDTSLLFTWQTTNENCVHPEETEDSSLVRNTVQISIIEVLSPALCAAGYGPVGQFLEKWLPQKAFRECLLRTDEATDVSSEVLWQRRKCLFYELAKTSITSVEMLPTHEALYLRFSSFVEVKELEPEDRASDRPWMRLTPMDKALIRQELNDYKLVEMPVHQESLQYTRFHHT